MLLNNKEGSIQKSVIFEQRKVMTDLKLELQEACVSFVQNKLHTIDKIMQANQLALENESKSSAGDKHETGRAMLHLEMEKASQQLEVVRKMKEVLGKIDPSAQSNHARLGSLVTTSQGFYYLSISAGELAVKNKTYYAVSSFSPIGALLLGKTKGDRITMGERQIDVLAVD